MTLTTRLCVFFLAVLACVLVGFSTTFYLLARRHLYRQVDERVEASLNTLVAAAETGEYEVEWEPHERRVLLSHGAADGPLVWMVHDDLGNRLDGSGDISLEYLFADVSRSPLRGPHTSQDIFVEGRTWRVSHRHVESQAARTPSTHSTTRASAVANGQRRYPALLLTVGVSLAPVQTTLRNLTLVLAGLSLGLWLLAALAGRMLGRRALVPLTRMAASARSMDAADLDQRLPDPRTGDELEDLGRAFNELLGRLQESFERQRRFTGDASHQLRTPLTAMLGQIQVALRRHRSPEEYRQVLDRAQQQTMHLLQIVEMLLFLARTDTETKLPHLKAIDLAGWLTEHLRSWSGHARARDLRLERAHNGPLWINAQSALLGQLVDNLLDNACKYSEPTTLITLRLRGANSVVLLEVENAGDGVCAEDLPHLFEPFYRSEQARRLGVPGVGLGLAVARQIAAAFGGRLFVQCLPGPCARFTLQLPAAPTECVGPQPHSP